MIDDGGPAFPLQDWDQVIHSRRLETGMSLRDWFAGQALSIMSQYWMDNTPENDAVRVSEQVYKIADAMIAERNKNASNSAS